jgi:hypothetical protein
MKNSKTLGKGSIVQRNYASLVQKIFDEDQRIRFVAIYAGRDLIAGGMRPGVPSYDPEEEARELDLELARIAKSTSNSERWFGMLEGIVVTYAKLNLALFPLEGTERFVVVSSEPDFNLQSLLAKLRTFL